MCDQFDDVIFAIIDHDLVGVKGKETDTYIHITTLTMYDASSKTIQVRPKSHGFSVST